MFSEKKSNKKKSSRQYGKRREQYHKGHAKHVLIEGEDRTSSKCQSIAIKKI